MFTSFGRSILEWLRGAIDKMLNSNQITTAIQSQVGSVYNISAEMVTALQQWSAIYLNTAEWLNADVHSMNLGAAISGEIARTVTIEMDLEISGSPRADFLKLQMEPVLAKVRQQVEYGNAKGGLFFKPYVDGDSVCVDYVQADMAYPLQFDANQNVTGCVFADRRKVGAYWYTRFESHRMLPGDQYQIRNKAFRSDSQAYLGSEVPLSAIPEWADLQPDITIGNVTKPLFGYFRFPQANNIDPTSPLGVSCFARAVKLIEQADKQYSRLVWEFESGERALYVDKSAMEKDGNGNYVTKQKRLHRVLNIAPASISDPGFYKEWSPNLREASLLNGLNAILRQIEFVCGMDHGIISNPEVQTLTATEIKAGKQRYYTTVTDSQKSLKTALDGLLYAMDVWASIYNLAPMGNYETVYSFDDSIVADHDTQFEQDKSVVEGGGMGWVEFRMRNFGETEAIAKQKVQQAQEEKKAANPPPPVPNNIPVTQPAEV